MSFSFLDTRLAAFSIRNHQRKPQLLATGTTLTLWTCSLDTIVSWVLPTGTCKRLYSERAVNPSCWYKKTLFTGSEPIRAAPGQRTPAGQDAVGGESQVSRTGAHTAQHIRSGTWPTFFSDSRDFCLVGGSSTWRQKQVPKDAPMASLRPLTL